ncbi:chalcone isomerase family protein [Bacterioplanoides sp.]|uniref:chalcone isomerase family protein n=1 Tax=Bacterioplanoides sp. TaxID=2066072 RepID=UPI003B00F962
MTKLLAFLTVTLMTIQAHSLVLSEVEVPQSITARDNQTALSLKGAAIRRTYGIIKTYVGQLYLADTNLTAEQILASEGARRMVFHIVTNRARNRRFISSINDSLPQNLSAEEIAVLRPRLDKMGSLLDVPLEKDTVFYIEWEPASQLNYLVVNGELKGSVPGLDINNAILQLWIGENPIGRDFKQEILGLAEARD